MPQFEDRYLQGKCFAGRFDAEAGIQGRPRCAVLHIQQGTMEGSYNEFLNNPKSATVMIGRDGAIWRVVHEEDGPWTNGDLWAPTPAGQRVRSWGGNPNIWSLTIETEGYSYWPNVKGWPADPKPAAQMDAVVWQLQDWMNRYQIDRENVIRHADINTGPEKIICPGDAFYNAVMDRLGYCDPAPPPPFDGTDKQVDNVTFHADQRTVTVAVDELNRRRWADSSSCKTGSPLTQGQTAETLYWVEGELVDGEPRWWVSLSGSRIWVGGTVEKPEQT